MSQPDSIEKYLTALLKQEGFPYIWPCEANGWSAKGRLGCDYPDGRDCSGAVTWALWKAGYPDVRANTSAQKMWTEWRRTDSPEAGDLILYGRDKHASHVMTLLADGTVFGATGGNSDTTTPAQAFKHGACVQHRPSPEYRPDRVGAVVNPLRVVWEKKKPLVALNPELKAKILAERGLGLDLEPLTSTLAEHMAAITPPMGLPRSEAITREVPMPTEPPIVERRKNVIAPGEGGWVPPAWFPYAAGGLAAALGVIGAALAAGPSPFGKIAGPVLIGLGGFIGTTFGIKSAGPRKDETPGA